MVADRVGVPRRRPLRRRHRGAGRRGAGGRRPPGTLLDLGGGTGHHLAGVLDAAARTPWASCWTPRPTPPAGPPARIRGPWPSSPTPGRGCRCATAPSTGCSWCSRPRNGPEIARVLRPGGRLVVVTPAPDHLAELVGPLGLLRVDPDKAARLAASLEPHLRAGGATRRTGSGCGWTGPRCATLVGHGPARPAPGPGRRPDGAGGAPRASRVTVSVQIATYRRTRPSWTRRAPTVRAVTGVPLPSRRGVGEAPSKLRT